MAKSLDVIQPNETWDIIDPTKLSQYIACPRKYFFNYILGWRSDYPINHLTFGVAWHSALEHLHVNNFSKESYEQACLIFLKRYREDFPPESDRDMVPKDPMNALSALSSYAHKFSQDLHDFSLLHTEIGGVVMISPSATMHFKMDLVQKRKSNNKILFIDFKTSQYKTSHWMDTWKLSTQMLTYLHVLHCLYPREEIEGGIVRTTYFYKSEMMGAKKPKENEHLESAIIKTPEQLQAWLVRTNHYYQNLKYDMLLLEEDDNTDNVAMNAFQQREQECFSYNKPCIYLDFCNAWSNPISRADRVPIGFRKEFWDPRDEPTKETVNLSVDMGEI